MNQQEKIKEVNSLLIERFGIPKRNKKLPDPLDMLIGTILSQNTNDKNSFQAYNNLRTKYPDWTAAAQADRRSIEKEIKIAGLGLQKSKAIKDVFSTLKKKYGKILLHVDGKENSVIIDELTSIKGVGVKTASCVLLFALDRNVCPVDTHVHRTVNRLGIVNAGSPDKTFEKLNENFPPKIAHSFHTNLIRLGREICKPKNPACGICPLFDLCVYENKDQNSVKTSIKNDFFLLDKI